MTARHTTNEPSDWTPERTRLLQDLWQAGDLSAAKIAIVMTGVSRCAVIAKANRMGLRRPPATRSARAINPPQRKRPATIGRPEAIREPDQPVSSATARGASTTEPRGLAASYAALAPSGCKWPIGDPQDEDFSVCGATRGRGPYCTRHAEAAYQKRPSRLPDAWQR